MSAAVCAAMTLHMCTETGNRGDRRGQYARYNEELIARHVSGRLKVAPRTYRRRRAVSICASPPFSCITDSRNCLTGPTAATDSTSSLIPYFILKLHPGCREEDMAELAAKTRALNPPSRTGPGLPRPPLMTLATEIYYTGYHPYTGTRIYGHYHPVQKQAQRK